MESEEPAQTLPQGYRIRPKNENPFVPAKAAIQLPSDATGFLLSQELRIPPILNAIALPLPEPPYLITRSL